MWPAPRLRTFVDRVAGRFATPGAATLRFPAEPWCIDSIATSAALTVVGWALLDEPRNGGDYSARFAFNGRRFDRLA